MCLFLINGDEEGWLWSALIYMFCVVCGIVPHPLNFFCMVCNLLVLFFSFFYISLSLSPPLTCALHPFPSLFSTTDRVRSPSDRSQAAPEQQRLDDAIGFLRDHAEVMQSCFLFVYFKMWFF